MEAETIIRDLELWSEPPHIEPIPAGYTNQNFRVVAAGEAYHARVGQDLPWHGISRENEARCARIAAGAGIAPEVLYAQGGVLVTRFVEGETLKLGVTPDRATLAAVARLLAEVHRQPALPALAKVDLVQICRGYLVLPGCRQLAARDRRTIERFLNEAPPLGAECFVHGDAFPENFIDDRHRLWLIDWEYAGRGHAAADLAYVAMNFELSGSDLQAFVEVHGGSVDANAVRALIPVAAARDLLWCLSEIEARGLTQPLWSYTELCCYRLGIAYRPGDRAVHFPPPAEWCS